MASRTPRRSPADFIAAAAAPKRPSQVELALDASGGDRDEWVRFLADETIPATQLARALSAATGVQVGDDSVKQWRKRNP